MQDLFTSIDNYLAQEGHYAFRVRLDASHPVYRGHFPGHPVLPGVCTLQLVRVFQTDCKSSNRIGIMSIDTTEFNLLSI